MSGRRERVPERHSNRRPDRRPERDDRGSAYSHRNRERSPSHDAYNDGQRHDDRRGNSGYNRSSYSGTSRRQDEGRHDYSSGGRARTQSGVSTMAPQVSKDAAIPSTGSELKLRDLEPRGHVGKPLTVLTNHFVIQSLPIVTTYQYDIQMRVPASSQRRGNEKVSAIQMAKAMQAANPLWGKDPSLFVFDDVSIGWSTEAICEQGSVHKSVVDLPGHTNDRPNQVEIKIRNTGPIKVRRLVEFVRGLSLGGQIGPPQDRAVNDCFKAISAVYRKDAAKKFLSFPKSSAFFTGSPELSMVLQSTGGILEAIRGIYQSLSFNFGKLSLNVDTACTAFFCAEKCLVDLVQAFVGVRSIRELDNTPTAQIASDCSRINGVFFVVHHLGDTDRNNQKIRVQSLTPAGASDTTFEHTDKLTGAVTTVTVEAYYKAQYNITLQYPRLPLADTRSGKFPLEMCFTAKGERYKEALQGSETSDFIKFSTSPAYVRSNQILENIKQLEWDTQPIPQTMGLSVRPSMLELNARLLPVPVPLYGNGSDRQGPASGSWNLRGKTFANCAGFQSWGVLHFGGSRNSSEQELMEYCRGLCNSFGATGLRTPNSAPVLLRGNPQGDIGKAIVDLAAKTASSFKARPDILLFFLSQQTCIPAYKAIKNVCEVQLGIPSQVMLVEKAFGKGGLQYQANVGMKVNVKLGGVNTRISEALFQRESFMMLGADRSHASPGELRVNPPPPGYSALVGTYDTACVQYTGVSTSQQSANEMIADLKPMAEELFRRYKVKNDNLPDRVIYWRDGIAESQVPAFMETEVKTLMDVRDKCGKKFKLTVVNCVKRHHTRLFPRSERGDKLGNVFPGTVVENSSSRNDVFIVTQSALQGTCRPTHYTVLMDENNLSADDFHRLIMHGCFSYARATRSVSIHSAVYYSDLLCERARLHWRVENGNSVHKDVDPNLYYTMYWQ